MSWDWEVFCKEIATGERIPGCFGAGADQTYLNWLLSAWGWTLTVSLGALAIAFIFGVVMGALRTLPGQTKVQRAMRALSLAWTELFRNIPILVQVFLWYFVVPAVFPVLQAVPPVIMVIMALGFFTSARISEQVRAGLQSLPKGQRYAAMALGLSTGQSYRWVLLPMALRVIIPPLTSEAMNVVKNSSVAFAVSIAELTFFARQSAEETAQPILMYFAVTLLYAATALLINRLMRWLEQKTRVPGFVAMAASQAH